MLPTVLLPPRNHVCVVALPRWMKFASGEYEIDAEEARKLRNRIEAFRRGTGTKCGIHLTFVTPYGVKRNKYWSLVQSEVTLDDLFA